MNHNGTDNTNFYPWIVLCTYSANQMPQPHSNHVNHVRQSLKKIFFTYFEASGGNYRRPRRPGGQGCGGRSDKILSLITYSISLTL